ncbi:palmitoyltransferase ZDHHC12-B-like [Glandiceps talaboti]
MVMTQKLFWMITTGIFIRSIHVGLTLAVVLVLFLKDTAISRAIKDGEYVVPSIFTMCVLVPTGFYFIASLIDPGYIKKEHQKKKPSIRDVEHNGSDTSSDEDITSEVAKMLDSPTKVKLKKCSFCKIIQPMRVKHCRDCEHCVRRFDHHCPWLDNCVGERNHRYFWLFLLTETAVILWSLVMIWNAFKYQREWKEWFSYNVFLVMAFCILLFGLMVTGLLLGCHTYLIAMNTTTWEFMSRHRINYLKDLESEDNPFHEGLVKNFLKFLCYCSIRRWELLYSKRSDPSRIV